MKSGLQPYRTEKICNVTDTDPVEKGSKTNQIPGKNQAENKHGCIHKDLKVSKRKAESAGQIAVHKAAGIGSKAGFYQK